MKSKWHILFTLFIFPVLVFGQSQSGVLDLEDCIHLALQNNYNFNLASIDKKIAEKNYLQSYSNILPEVQFSYSGSKYERGPSSYLGNEYIGENPALPSTYEVTTGHSYYAEVQASQTIFDGGRWYLNIKKSQYDKKSSDYMYLSSRQEVIVTVRQYYMDLLKQQELLKVKEQAVERSRQQLERVKSMYEIGSVAQVDVYRSEVNLGNDRIQLLNQQNNVRQARESLNIAIGREPETGLEIKKDIKFEKQVGDLNEIVSKAVSNNPDIRSQQFVAKSSKYGVRIAQSAFLPNLSAFTYYQRRVPQFKGLYEQFDREYSWAVGLSISWNLFNGFSDYLGVQKAHLNKKYANQKLEFDKLNLKSRVSNLYNNLKALNEIIDINETNLTSAQEDYRLAEERYRLGSGTLLDLRDAQVNLVTAEQILVAARYDAYITYAELQQAMGNLVDEYE